MASLSANGLVWSCKRQLSQAESSRRPMDTPDGRWVQFRFLAQLLSLHCYAVYRRQLRFTYSSIHSRTQKATPPCLSGYAWPRVTSSLRQTLPCWMLHWSFVQSSFSQVSQRGFALGGCYIDLSCSKNKGGAQKGAPSASTDTSLVNEGTTDVK